MCHSNRKRYTTIGTACISFDTFGVRYHTNFCLDSVKKANNQNKVKENTEQEYKPQIKILSKNQIIKDSMQGEDTAVKHILPSGLGISGILLFLGFAFGLMGNNFSLLIKMAEFSVIIMLICLAYFVYILFREL